MEDAEALRLLRELGCDTAQGYYISPPLPRDEFRAWYLQRGGAVARGRGAVGAVTKWRQSAAAENGTPFASARNE